MISSSPFQTSCDGEWRWEDPPFQHSSKFARPQVEVRSQRDASSHHLGTPGEETAGPVGWKEVHDKIVENLLYRSQVPKNNTSVPATSIPKHLFANELRHRQRPWMDNLLRWMDTGSKPIGLFSLFSKIKENTVDGHKFNHLATNLTTFAAFSPPLCCM